MRERARAGRAVWSILTLLLLACACPSLPGIGGRATPTASLAGFVGGEMVIAASIDPATNAPVDRRRDFAAGAPVIYAVTEVVSVEPGTTFFVRWARAEGEVIRDARPVVADRRYENTYLAFDLRSSGAGGLVLEPGEYIATLFVNGREGPSAAFTIGR